MTRTFIQTKEFSHNWDALGLRKRIIFLKENETKLKK